MTIIVGDEINRPDPHLLRLRCPRPRLWTRQPS